MTFIRWQFAYMIILLVSIGSLLLADWKYKLVFFNNLKAGIKSIIITMLVLLIGDNIGINWQIFSTNQSYVSGFNIGSENLPIEEFLFLFLLCYSILVIYIFLKRLKNV